MAFRRIITIAAVSTCTLVAAVNVLSPAQAGPAQPQVVSAVPATYTPDIKDGHVNAITRVGSRTIVAGTFSNVMNHGSTAVVHQHYLFASNAASGLLDRGFLPTLDGPRKVSNRGRAPTPCTSRALSKPSIGWPTLRSSS